MHKSHPFSQRVVEKKCLEEFFRVNKVILFKLEKQKKIPNTKLSNYNL